MIGSGRWIFHGGGLRRVPYGQMGGYGGAWTLLGSSLFSSLINA